MASYWKERNWQCTLKTADAPPVAQMMSFCGVCSGGILQKTCLWWTRHLPLVPRSPITVQTQPPATEAPVNLLRPKPPPATTAPHICTPPRLPWSILRGNAGGRQERRSADGGLWSASKRVLCARALFRPGWTTLADRMRIYCPVYHRKNRETYHWRHRRIHQYLSSGKERCVILGLYIVENNATVRSTASRFGISKSTVHKDVTQTLKNINRSLYLDVKSVLEKNKNERHIRGGEATKKKYLQ